MTLWTPNPKTVEPVRVCPRCGGYGRRIADRGDFRRYLSLHRICCCDEGVCDDNSSVYLALSGITLDTSCRQFGPSKSVKYTAMSDINGTRTIPKVAENATYCEYELDDENDDASSTEVRYDPSTTCSGTPSETLYNTGIYAQVIIYKSSGYVQTIRAYSATSTEIYGQSRYFYFNGTGYYVGDSIDNECDIDTTSSCISEVGTATVTYP